MNYQIDEIYHFSNKRGQNDQYMDWFYDGEKTIACQGGIRVRSYKKPKIIQAPYGISSAIVVVSNNHEKDKYVVPWEPAEFNEETGQLIYKGDSRKYKKDSDELDKRSKLQHMGNKHFHKIEQVIEDQNNQWLPPVLYFSSIESGRYAFKGLFIPRKLTSYYDDSPHVEKENYKLHCDRVEKTSIPLAWLRDRRLTENVKNFDTSHGFENWNLI